MTEVLRGAFRIATRQATLRRVGHEAVSAGRTFFVTFVVPSERPGR